MDIISIIRLLGGLALFLFGMNVMGEALEKQGGSKIKVILEKMTSNPLKGVLLGAVVTAIIQSSSATTVMVVGFVNSGIMKLSQSIGIILGSNIGTTITSWIISLTGIKSDNIFMQFLKPANFSFVLAFIGIIFYMFLKKSGKKDIGLAFLGFTVLICGLDFMSGAVKPLSEIPEFRNILLLFSNPVLGIATGALLTAIIQSSSASVGILQVLSSTGQIKFSGAVPIILGQNIGTCITAMLSSVGTNKNARRAAVVHLLFNVIGATVFLILFYLLDFIIGFTFMDSSVNENSIAIIHTLFNVFSTIIMLPFVKQLEKLTYIIVRDDETESKDKLLDERLFGSPTIAISQAKRITDKMANISKNSIKEAISAINKYDAEKINSIVKNEDQVDIFEDKLGTYLVRLSREPLTVDDSHQISMLLHCIGDFERISDHALNLAEVAEEINQKKVVFSSEAKNEIDHITHALNDILDLTIDSFINEDIEKAKLVEPFEQVVDGLKATMRANHIIRLQNNRCTIETGFIYSDLITNIERIADHCSNIAVCMIRIHEDKFDTHNYLHSVKDGHDKEFERNYREYEAKYGI